MKIIEFKISRWVPPLHIDAPLPTNGGTSVNSNEGCVLMIASHAPCWPDEQEIYQGETEPISPGTSMHMLQEANHDDCCSISAVRPNRRILHNWTVAIGSAETKHPVPKNKSRWGCHTKCHQPDT